MMRMLRRVVAATTLVALCGVPGGAAQIPVSAPEPMVVDASPAHPVLSGGIGATARRPATRAELITVVGPGSSIAINQAATATLAAALRAALPELAIDARPTALTVSGGLHMVSGPDAGGVVRVAVPGPVDDGRLRALLERARGAIDATHFDPSLSASIRDVALGVPSCAAFDRTADDDAASWVRTLALELGDPRPARPSLADRTAQPQPPRPHLLCGDDLHTREIPLQRTLVPTTSIATDRRTYAFALPLRGPVVTSRPAAIYVPDTAVAYAPWSDVLLSITSPEPVLTVDGFAPPHLRYVESRYVWEGLNGAYRRGEAPSTDDAGVRARLRALGIADEAILTQHNPAEGQRFVEVRTADETPRESVVAAIAGDSAIERHEVRFLRDRDDCRPQPADVASAVADAAARAQAVAAALGTRVETTRPIAIDLLTSLVEPCITRDTPPYDDRIEHHVAGSLEVGEPYEAVGVIVSFPMRAVALRGSSDDPGMPPGIDENALRFQLVAPPIAYAAARSSGEARAVDALPATVLLARTRFVPNGGSSEAMVPADVPRAFADRLGATSANSTLSLAAIEGGDAKHPRSEWRSLIALPATASNLAALAAARAAGNTRATAWTEILPQRDTCGRLPLALALRAIRGAAFAAHRDVHARRLVAIDLAGPYAVQGRCDRSSSLAQWPSAGGATADVRLAAYARVSYAP